MAQTVTTNAAPGQPAPRRLFRPGGARMRPPMIAGHSLAMSAPLRPRRGTGRHRHSAWCCAVLGVVYGDIGTSPLYAFKASLQHFKPGDVTNLEIMGILSLIFWSLVLVVTVKYVLLILLADNRGEGGILALMALGAARLGRRAGAQHPDPDRHRRCLPVLRRRRHHAGDLGAVGRRGPGGLGARAEAIRAADQRCRDPPAVRRTIARHRQCRPRVRPDHGGVVPVDRPAGHMGDRAASVRAAGAVAQLRGDALPAPRIAGLRRARLRRALRDRRRGAVCRHGTLRPGSDPRCLAVLRAALPGAELFRPGRAADRRA